MTSPRPQPTAPAVLALLTAVSACLWVVMAVPAPACAQPAEPSADAAPDPRAHLVELQRQGRWGDALDALQDLAAEDPDRAGLWGLHVLAGDLHQRLDEPERAREAFIEGMTFDGDLSPYSRYRLAQEHARADHPEIAAGLVATVVAGATGASDPVPGLAEAVDLLREGIEAGGNCNLLNTLKPEEMDTSPRRDVLLTRGLCLVRKGQPDSARQLYRELLEERLTDEVALTAARRLEELAVDDLVGVRPSAEERRLLGLAFHQHREFSDAVGYLAPLVAGFEGDLDGERYDLAYTLVRSRFWQERYAQAARGFAALAARAGEPRLVARALYQQARSHELLGEWPRAIATFRRAYRADPLGRSADGALVGAMRLEWRSGRERSALELFELLESRREWSAVTSRAAFFLAASDLAQGRSDRAGSWLDVAERTGGGAAEPELSYWHGRLAELEGDADLAVRRYLRVMRDDAYHPLAVDAGRRLGRPPLEEPARALARRRAGGGGLDDLYDAWLLSAGDPGARGEVAHRLARALAADPQTGPFVSLSLVSTGDWPLWGEGLASPAEKLVALGLWEGGENALPEHFPLRDPSLGYTRAWLLARSGMLRDSVLVAELMARGAPARLPEPFLPIGLQRLLYPLGHTDVLVRESLGRGIDPFLLAAIVREESRFQRDALSPASARGLTQFILPTALRVAGDIGLPPLEPHHLYRPEVALALGAAYLAELEETFDGTLHPVVVSYNAGPNAARLWRSYAFTNELPEFYTKVSYRETRNYLRKVLSSWHHYRQIYGAPVER